ncbi:unnamed protein product [Ranitomeya imitator]|uniref:Uncharacterized protein n=1 Tax=Ranitomeya imitator TaxID=111125 RepID=A0ABN9MMM3_9NEOB|nr:unnamed protein product [Ranitomeya imitator]
MKEPESELELEPDKIQVSESQLWLTDSTALILSATWAPSLRISKDAKLLKEFSGHDCCEHVKVLLFASKKGLSAIVAQEDFEFIKDEAYESAQFLASSAGNQQALLFAKFFLNKSRSSPGDAVILDKKITLAFRHLQLPSGWNVLGDFPSITDGPGQETLMHFAARLGLCALSKFLLEQPGGRTSLAIANNEGATPVTLALERGFLKLHHVLTQYTNIDYCRI